MARNAECKMIPSHPVHTRCVQGDLRFCFRYELEDAALRDSVRRHGILVPLVVQKRKNRYRVIAGHKRLAAARALKLKEVPVLEIGKGLSEKEAFLLALASNWRQEIPEMDRAAAVGKAFHDLGFGAFEVRNTVMPLLGLSADPATFNLYLRAYEMPASLKDLLHKKRIPFRACGLLLRFSRREQEIFAARIAAKAQLTASQWLQTLEWLSDILKRDRKDLKTVLARDPFQKVFRHAGMDPRTRADRFFDAVKKARFPGITAHLERFAKARKSILGRETSGFRIEPAANSEEKGVDLHFRAKNPADLDRVLEKISKNKPELNSLFDFEL